MKKLNVLLAGVVVAMSSACAVAPGVNSDGTCSHDFISDYNSLVNSGRGALEQSSLESLKAQAQAFKAKYPGTSCLASIGGADTQINSDQKMDEIIGAIDSSLNAMSESDQPAPSADTVQSNATFGVEADGSCSNEFISDLNAISKVLRGFKKVGDLYEARDLAVNFQKKYPGVKCIALNSDGVTTTTIDAQARMNGIIETIDKVIKNSTEKS